MQSPYYFVYTLIKTGVNPEILVNIERCSFQSITVMYKSVLFGMEMSQGIYFDIKFHWKCRFFEHMAKINFFWSILFWKAKKINVKLKCKNCFKIQNNNKTQLFAGFLLQKSQFILNSILMETNNLIVWLNKFVWTRFTVCEYSSKTEHWEVVTESCYLAWRL